MEEPMPTTSRALALPQNRFTTLALAGALALAATGGTSLAAHAQDDSSVEFATTTGDLGTYLVDGNGITLYYFTPDIPGVSVCEGDCLEAWPALVVGEGQFPFGDDSVTGTLGFGPRSDGTQQATYRGRPLYYFAGDGAAGDTNGQGLGDVWYVAAEDGSVPNPSTVSAPELVLEANEGDLGTFITATDGRTAYYFTVDSSPGVSLCSDDCLEAWPPVTVADGVSVAAGEGVPGVVGVIAATDGSPQVTYDGHPLYYFAGDAAAGDVNGQNVGGVWYVATIDGLLPPS
jgi:predicted lipoprotein with Yx(FWY)xxD motif